MENQNNETFENKLQKGLSKKFKFFLIFDLIIVAAVVIFLLKMR